MEPETKARDQSPKAAMDQRARETAGELKVKEVEADVFLAHHPCSSLLQLLLRACAGCLGLHGYCSDDDCLLKPAAANDDDAAAPAVAETPKEGAGGGEAASEARTRVRKSPSPPDTPRGGSGDDGGKHH